MFEDRNRRRLTEQPTKPSGDEGPPSSWYGSAYRAQLKDYRLDHDASNLFCPQINAVWEGKGDCSRLRPLETYEEYLWRKHAKTSIPQFAQLVIDLSDPDAIREFDDAVRDFNEQLEMIQATGDAPKAFAILKKIHDICYSPR